MKKLFLTSVVTSALASPLLAQETEYSTSYSSSGQVSPMFLLAWGVFMLVMLIALWKVFTKAGQPGWAVLIPIYNLYVLCKIAGRPGWWLLLMMIPLVNLIIMIVVYVDIAKNFGNGAGFAIGMLLLPFIFIPILGFGSSQYQESSAAAAA